MCSNSPPAVAAVSASCGVERWRVKTLGDRPRLFPVAPTTVGYLVTRRAPRDLPNRRLPFERHVFRLVARVAFVRPEADSDLHLGLVDCAGRTMIAEAALPACAFGATPLRKRQMALARARVRVCAIWSNAALAAVCLGATGSRVYVCRERCRRRSALVS